MANVVSPVFNHLYATSVPTALARTITASPSLYCFDVVSTSGGADSFTYVSEDGDIYLVTIVVLLYMIAPVYKDDTSHL
jgi:hypothetical protein